MNSLVFRQLLEDKRQQGLLRQRQVLEKGLVNFSSNDYLALSQSPGLAESYQQGFKRYPIGSGGSMLICGYHDSHKALEKAFSEFLEVDDSLLVSSGYTANLAITALLKQAEATCIIDKGVHASIYDGLQQAKVPFVRFQHNCLEDFNSTVLESPANAVVITEGIFSMSGQQAPLSQIAEKGIDLIVDEAHSFGILGHQGRGAVNQSGLSVEAVPLRVIPLGKAMAGQGAIIAGDKIWLDALQQVARSYIYSTGFSPAMAYGLQCALEQLADAEEARRHLGDLIQLFRECIKQSSLTWENSSSPIQQLQLGCPFKAMEVYHHLKQNGLLCLPMRQPTVSLKATGLRIILNASHQSEEVLRLFDLLQRWSVCQFI